MQPEQMLADTHKEMLIVMINKKKKNTQITSRSLEILLDQHGHLKYRTASIHLYSWKCMVTSRIIVSSFLT